MSESEQPEVESVPVVSAFRQFNDSVQTLNMWKLTPEQRSEFYRANSEVVHKMSEECQAARTAREKLEREARAERVKEDAKRKWERRNNRKRE